METKSFSPSFFYWLSFLGLVSLLLFILGFGLLPFLLGLLSTRTASIALSNSRLFQAHTPTKARFLASFGVGGGIFILLGLGSWWLYAQGKQMIQEAPFLLQRLSAHLHDIIERIPSSIKTVFPMDPHRLQESFAKGLQHFLPSFAGWGHSWLVGTLWTLLGGIVGLLMAHSYHASQDSTPPLTAHVRARTFLLNSMFQQIVRAQFFVACANTFFALVYFFIILPLFQQSLPFSWALVFMTAVLSMIPVAGNLICNAVVVLVALSVGPGIAVASLVYLVLVHKIEYFINARVVGTRISASIWELLLVMFALEAVFGVGGLVAAPLFYAYIKAELHSLGWV